MTRIATFNAAAVAVGLLACQPPDPGDDPSPTTSALIAPVDTSDPVTMHNFGWDGAKQEATVSDGNVLAAAGNDTTTIRYQVTVPPAGPLPDFKQRKLTVSYNAATGKLTVTSTIYVPVAPDLEQVVAYKSVQVTPNVGIQLSKFTQSAGTVICPAPALGPYVVWGPDCYDPLLDQRTLSRLPSPKFVNGTPVADNLLLALFAAGAYKQVYNDHLLLWDTLRFRADLMAPSLDRTMAYNTTRAFLIDTELADHHGDINHGQPLGDNNEDWTDLGHHAGFLDGHRAYVFEMEQWLSDQPQSSMPFRRTPAWIPRRVPAEYNQDALPDLPGTDVDTTTGGPGVRFQHRPGIICQTFDTASTPRLQAMTTGGVDIDGWHGGVHLRFGGHFRDFRVTAHTPLFWAWHAAVDSVWANLQRCYLDDGDSL